MTEREIISFNVYNETTNTASNGNTLPFNKIDFNIGGDFDTSSYQYTFLKSGTYLIGLSYTKQATNAAARIFLKRGNSTTGISVSNKPGMKCAKNTAAAIPSIKDQFGDNKRWRLNPASKAR